ncbi:hypothetical protein [Streptomonospora salina]|uniref:Uncharacterized protein n=1 Tax=Streptomonospora salina TaxID=104205 RepID=A0A841EH26_9ACTN|nr:hypothetical protein [Streptomonospora salina]MBB6000128.1 hypothetical protein [Streptomonospora salina]
MSASENDVLDPETGRPRLLARRCSTCVFHPDNRMHLPPGRLAEVVDANRDAGSGLTCHQTLSYADTGVANAWCRGFYDAYPRTLAFRLARLLLGGVTEVEPPS